MPRRCVLCAARAFRAAPPAHGCLPPAVSLQVASAVAALKKHLAKEAAAKNGLFEEDDMFNLVRAARRAASRLHCHAMLLARPPPGVRRALRALTRGAPPQVIALKKTPQEAKPKPYRMCVARRALLRRLRWSARCAASAREAADELLWIPLHKPLAALPDYPVLMPHARRSARAAARTPRFAGVRAHARAARSEVPHPIWQTEGSEVCLFVKDHQGAPPRRAAAALMHRRRSLRLRLTHPAQARARPRRRRAWLPTRRAAAWPR